MAPTAEKSVIVLSSSSLYSLTKPEITLCRALGNLGLHPIIVCPKEASLTKFMREQGFQVEVIPDIERWRNLGIRLRSRLIIGKLLKIAAHHKVALVHAARLSTTPFAVKLARRLGVPCISHLHGVPPDQAKFRRYLVHETEVLISVTKAALGNYGPTGKTRVEVIYNGMEVKAFIARAAEFDARAQLGLDNSPLIGMNGPTVRKGVDIFIEAAEEIAEKYPEARFMVMGRFGDEHYESKIRARIEALGLVERLIFPGYQYNIAPFMAASDIWIVPSRHDAAPMVIQEAMALGKPVIGSRFGGIPELIENGVTGFIVPPEDPQALAQAIDELLKNPLLRQNFGETGRQRALAEFTLERFFERISEVYRDLLETSSV